MKINIVSYEDLNEWICGKIARRLYEALLDLKYEVYLSNAIREDCDINHHIIYTGYKGSTSGIHTIFITHVDNHVKLKNIQAAINSVYMGICMSEETMNYLRDFEVPANKLTYIHMAHDGLAKPKKFVVGLTTRLYPDGRKNENMLDKLIEEISPNDFEFKIMGFGWEAMVKKMMDLGFKVEYIQDFDYDKYMDLMASLDYYLYMGADEGSAGFIDALAAGVKTIVQPQGFHNDAPNGVTHPFQSYKELKNVFASISHEKGLLTAAVAPWTWKNYALKHLEVWESAINGTPYTMRPLNTPHKSSNKYLKLARLYAGWLKQRIILVSNLGKEYETGSRFFKKKKR